MSSTISAPSDRVIAAGEYLTAVGCKEKRSKTCRAQTSFVESAFVMVGSKPPLVFVCHHCGDLICDACLDEIGGRHTDAEFPSWGEETQLRGEGHLSYGIAGVVLGFVTIFALEATTARILAIPPILTAVGLRLFYLQSTNGAIEANDSSRRIYKVLTAMLIAGAVAIATFAHGIADLLLGLAAIAFGVLRLGILWVQTSEIRDTGHAIVVPMREGRAAHCSRHRHAPKHSFWESLQRWLREWAARWGFHSKLSRFRRPDAGVSAVRLYLLGQKDMDRGGVELFVRIIGAFGDLAFGCLPSMFFRSKRVALSKVIGRA